MIESAREASDFLKVLANEHRLLVLCHLVDGEKSVTELGQLIGIRQPTLSQHLARLRAENLVETRREAKTVYYSLASREAGLVIHLLYKMFCERHERRIIE
jgi:DNA-binding transcriptional ArsR family regulator